MLYDPKTVVLSGVRQTKSYLKKSESGLFDSIDRLDKIDAMGDPLINLNKIMDWEIFTPVLELLPQAEPKGPGGRPGFHPHFLFKIKWRSADRQSQDNLPSVVASVSFVARLRQKGGNMRGGFNLCAFSPVLIWKITRTQGQL